MTGAHEHFGFGDCWFKGIYCTIIYIYINEFVQVIGLVTQ